MNCPGLLVYLLRPFCDIDDLSYDPGRSLRSVIHERVIFTLVTCSRVLTWFHVDIHKKSANVSKLNLITFVYYTVKWSSF